MAHRDYHHSSSSSGYPTKYAHESQSHSGRDSLPHSSSSSYGHKGMLDRTESEKISIAFPSSSKGKARNGKAEYPDSLASRQGRSPTSSRKGMSPTRESKREYEEGEVRESSHERDRRSSLKDSRSVGRRESASSKHDHFESRSASSRDYRERDRGHESSRYRESDHSSRRYSRESDRDRKERDETIESRHYQSKDRHSDRERDGDRSRDRDSRREREDERRRQREKDDRKRDSERGGERRESDKDRSRRDRAHKERDRERDTGHTRERRDSRASPTRERPSSSSRRPLSPRPTSPRPHSPPSNRWVARQKAESHSNDNTQAKGLLATDESRPKVHIPLAGTTSQSVKLVRPPPPHLEAKNSNPRPPSPEKRPATPPRPPSSPPTPSLTTSSDVLLNTDPSRSKLSIPLPGAAPTRSKTLVRPARPPPSDLTTASGPASHQRTTSLSSSIGSRPLTPPLPPAPAAVAPSPVAAVSPPPAPIVPPPQGNAPVATVPPPSSEVKEDAPPPPAETAPPIPEESPSPPLPPIKIPFQSSTLSGLTSLSRANPLEKKANGSSGPAPPSFHFRDLSKSRLPDEADSEASNAASKIAVPLPSSPAKSVTQASWVRPQYVAPACVKPRSGRGNFLVVKGADGKEDKRLDGMIDGKMVEVVDPRKVLSKEQLARGKGSAKQRDEFYEVKFQWDTNSTGPAPIPPPAAVLITGLSPLTTVDQITKFLRPHGRIKELDSKVNPKTGMQLGMCWVKFDAPPSGKPGTANDIANTVVKMCDGKRISSYGDEKIKVVLDGRGLRAAKAVKEEMERLYPPKKPVEEKKPTPAPTPTPATAPTSTPTPSTQVGSTPARLPSANGIAATGNQTPVVRPGPTIAPNGRAVYTKPLGQGYQGGYQAQRPFDNRFNSNQYNNRPYGFGRFRNLPYAPGGAMNPFSKPFQQPVQHLEASFTSAPFEQHGASADRGRSLNGRSSRDRSLSLTSSDSDSDYDRRPGRRGLSPYGQRKASKSGPSEEDEQKLAKIRGEIKSNGKPYIFVTSQGLPTTASYEGYLRDHFKLFKPEKVLQSHLGWYILFPEEGAAAGAKVLDGTLVQGRSISLAVQTSGPRVAQPLTAPADAPTTNADPTWKKMTIAKKNRPAVRKVEKEKLKPKKKVRPVESSSSEDEESPAPAAARKSRVKRNHDYSSDSSLSEDSTPQPRTKPAQVEAAQVEAETEPRVEVVPIGEEKPADASKHFAKSKKVTIASDDEDDDDEVPLSAKAPSQVGKAASKKRPAPAKSKKANKKARTEPDVAVESMDVDMPPPPAKKKKPTKTEVDKFVASGVLADEEDAYWLGRALAAQEDGEEPVFSDDEEPGVAEDHPLYHRSGAWRAEGWKNIPQVQKSKYLPQRNRAAVATEDNSVTTGRTARLAGRDQHRQTAAVAANQTVESDLFAFNQLRIRKKQLRFARSAIEGYGLYAMETIHMGEMVCEYVGDLIRATVADVREQVYLKQGIGSSYLFRIDNDIVCDATFKGSVSRLINHSCDPSANAKIIKVNGQSKIVIYAERTLYPGEEILYDYKFPLESDPALRVPCLCGAATCRGWLN